MTRVLSKYRLEVTLMDRIPRSKRKKPKKPYPSFPLTAHNNGQWCKKVRGVVHFFGVWADADAALNNYLRVAEDLHAGRRPITGTIASKGPTVKDVCNHYLSFEAQKLGSNEISPRTFKDYRRSAAFAVVAADIAENAKRIVRQCRRCDSGFTDVRIESLLSDFGRGDEDFNDQIVAEICKARGLTFITDDGDFSHSGLSILTANARLLASGSGSP